MIATSIINFPCKLPESWYSKWIEHLCLAGINRHTDTPRLWVSDKGAFEQMVLCEGQMPQLMMTDEMYYRCKQLTQPQLTM